MLRNTFVFLELVVHNTRKNNTNNHKHLSCAGKKYGNIGWVNRQWNVIFALWIASNNTLSSVPCAKLDVLGFESCFKSTAYYYYNNALLYYLPLNILLFSNFVNFLLGKVGEHIHRELKLSSIIRYLCGDHPCNCYGNVSQK